jgi:hypothetical protein
MNMVRHDFHFNELLSPAFDKFQDEGPQPQRDGSHQDFAPILGTKDHMIVAIVHNRMAALNYCPHASIVAENSNFVKESYAVRHTLLQPQHKERRSSPQPCKGRGFTRRVDNTNLLQG